MERFLKWLKVTLAGILLVAMVAGTLTTPAVAAGKIEIQPRTAVPTSINNSEEVPPTFVVETDESDESVHLWAGKNLIIAGNNLKTAAGAPNGLMLAAGNTLELSSEAEYGILFGNIINYSGESARDLFIAGNYVTLSQAAEVGRDVYVASDTLIVETDLHGDLSAMATTIELRDIEVAGNVNLTANTIKLTGNVKIAGALVYNENAEISGLEQATCGSVEAYQVIEVNTTTKLVTAIYSKVMSVAGLFLIMAIICAIYSKLHDKIATEADMNRFGLNLALGFGVLLLIPIVAILSFISFIAAPLGLVALALYVVMVYLAQGFAGVWLGHLIIEKGFKSKGNIFAEAFVGIAILGALSLIPYIGGITGFLGLILGLGLIVQCIKPTKDSVSNGKDITKKKTDSPKAKSGRKK